MAQPNFIILYVGDTAQSAAFYTTLLDKEPLESSPGFAMFALDSGVMLGLWARHAVTPAAVAPAGAGELAMAVADSAAVDTLYSAWSKRGLNIVQERVKLDFGYTFVALDPDGYRLRVFAPG